MASKGTVMYMAVRKNTGLLAPWMGCSYSRAILVSLLQQKNSRKLFVTRRVNVRIDDHQHKE